MTRSETNGFILAVLAVICWSPVFYVTAHGLDSDTPLTVFYFHVLLWAGLASGAMLTLMGRLDELGVFKKHETRILLLTVTGGYGLWLLKAMTIEQAGNELVQAHILFYTAPLLLGICSLPMEEGASWKQIGALLLGFVGCIMILAGPAGSKQVALPSLSKTTGLALGSALSWALFMLLARPLVRNTAVLPVSALIWLLGAACLFATCLSTGNNILSITRRSLWLSMALGVGSVALGLGLWLKSLSLVTPAFAAPIWYLSLIFGIAWSHWMTQTRPGWLAVGGVVLLLFVCRSGRSRGQSSKVTMSDIIRE